jgi:CheY-like chemotaxis protein
MDVEMPRLNGLEATRRIRQLEAEGILPGRIPLVGVSANAREEQRELMLASGMVRPLVPLRGGSKNSIRTDDDHPEAVPHSPALADLWAGDRIRFDHPRLDRYLVSVLVHQLLEAVAIVSASTTRA